MKNPFKNGLSLNAMLHNRKLIMIVSLIAAIAIWVAVLNGPANTETRPITVSASVDLTNTYAELIGLRLLDDTSVDVKIVVQGPWSVVSKLNADDFNVSINVNLVQKTGTQDLPISVASIGGAANYEILSYSPSVVTVTCDSWQEKTVRVETDTSTLSLSDPNEMRFGTPVFGTSAITGGQITLSGPRTEVSAVSYVVAKVSERATLSDVQNFEATLLAFDENDQPVEIPHCKFIGLETHTVSMTVPVLVYRDVPLSVTTAHMPAGFQREDGFVTINPSSIRVLGAADTLNSLTDIGKLGVLDFDHIDLSTASFTFTLPLPDTVEVASGSREATVTLNTAGLTTQSYSFTATNANVSFANLPNGVSASIPTQQFSDIRLVGRASSLSQISPANLQLVIDTDETSVPGSYRFTARVEVTGFDDVWAYYGEDAGLSIQATIH